MKTVLSASLPQQHFVRNGAEDNVPIPSEVVIQCLIRYYPIAVLAPIMGDSLYQKQLLARTLFPSDVKVLAGTVYMNITTEFIFINFSVVRS